jgi:hypothetical protein
MENEDAGAFAHPAASRVVVHLASEEPRHRIQLVHPCLSPSCQLVDRHSRATCVALVACLPLVPAGSMLIILIVRKAAHLLRQLGSNCKAAQARVACLVAAVACLATPRTRHPSQDVPTER